MSFDKKYAAIVFSAPVFLTALPHGEVEATESRVNEDSLPVPEPETPETAVPRVEVEKIEQRRGGIALQLYERRDGVYDEQEDSPVVATKSQSEPKQGLVYSLDEAETSQAVMENPLSDGLLKPARDTLPPTERSTDGFARIADDILGTVLLQNDEKKPDVQPQASLKPSEEPIASTPVDVPTVERERSDDELVTSLDFKGIEVRIPAHLQANFRIEIDGNSMSIRDKNETEPNNKTVPEVNTATEQQVETTSIVETNEQMSNSTQLDGLAQKVRDTAMPAGDGLYYMPNPTIKDGKVTYLFDKNTCNSERRGYPEHIAAVLAITDKYNELVSTDKYKQHKDTILDIGDFMSHVHIEHDEDNPAVDIRSRKLTTTSGIFDGPVFVPNSPNYDVDLTVELIEYIRTLEYDGIPVLKYIITKDTNGLAEKTAHIKRYYSSRNLMIFKDDHPEHVHLALTLYNESNDIEPEADFGYPCPVSGASFTEAHQVDETATDDIEQKDYEAEQNNSADNEQYIHAASPGLSELSETDIETIIVDDPELIEFIREEAQKDKQKEWQSPKDEVNPSLQTIIESVPDRTPVTKSAIRIGDINEASELARIVNVGSLTDGSRKAGEIVDDLSVHAQQLLNSIDAYAPVSPYVAASLRQENPSYAPYIKQLQNVDRRLSEHEILVRAKVAHEIVFGERYGSEFTEDNIKSDVERLVAFSIRESQRYPGAVGDYKTESENSGSSGLMQILDWDALIDTNNYEGIRDFDANLDPMQNLIHAYQLVDQNRQNGRSAFADWESGWKSDEGRRSDMEKYEENLARLREEGMYQKINNTGVSA